MYQLIQKGQLIIGNKSNLINVLKAYDDLFNATYTQIARARSYNVNDIYKEIPFSIPADTRSKNRRLLEKIMSNTIGLNYLLQELPTTVHSDLAYEVSITRLNVTGLIDAVKGKFLENVRIKRSLKSV